jgi:hypothetical protein
LRYRPPEQDERHAQRQKHDARNDQFHVSKLEDAATHLVIARALSWERPVTITVPYPSLARPKSMPVVDLDQICSIDNQFRAR